MDEGGVREENLFVGNPTHETEAVGDNWVTQADAQRPTRERGVELRRTGWHQAI